MTKSGLNVLVRQTTLPAAPKPSAEERKKAEENKNFLEGESGSVVNAELIQGPDGIHMDLTLKYHLRLPPEGNAVAEVNFQTEVAVWEGYPMVLNVTPSPRHEGKYLLVVARASVMNAGGWKLPRPEAPQASPAPH